jgi:hypothetical protein
MKFFTPSSIFFTLKNGFPENTSNKLITWLNSLGSIISVNTKDSQTFMADEMIVFSRSLDFLREEKFIDTVNDAIGEEEDSYKRAQSAIIWRRHTLIWAGEHCKYLDGDFCDFGCYDGIGSKIINDYCDLASFKKQLFIYDNFDTPPDSQSFPKHSPLLSKEVKERFKYSNNVKIIKGVLPESLKDNCPKKIAFAHIDLNNMPAEIAVLDIIYDRVVTGGIIILDDYGWSGYGDQQKEEKIFFNEKGLKILELPTGQGVILKR